MTNKNNTTGNFMFIIQCYSLTIEVLCEHVVFFEKWFDPSTIISFNMNALGRIIHKAMIAYYVNTPLLM